MTAAILMMLTLVSTLPASADPLDPYPLRVITHNVAGGPKYGGSGAAFESLAANIGWNPDVVMLQEVCLSQVPLFEQQYPGWSVHWAPTRIQTVTEDGQHIPGHPDCKGPAGTRYPQGILLASRWGIANVAVTPLRVPEASHPFVYTLLCGDVAVPAMTVRSCTTHLMSNFGDVDRSAEREEQTQVIRETLRPYISAQIPVVVGGDFNATPWAPAMDNLYQGRKGDFYEADQGSDPDDNAPTHGVGTVNAKKIDYIFFSKNRCVPPLSGLVVDGKASDHELLRGRCDLKVIPDVPALAL